MKAFKAIEQLVQGIFDDIWSSKKAKLISKCHTNDFILLEHGEVWTNVTTGNWCEHVKKRDQGIERINTFKFFKTKREGNCIWMAYHNYAKLKLDSLVHKAQWLESIVAVKKDTN